MSKKKNAPGKFAAKKKKSHKGLIVTLVILAILLAVAVVLFVLPDEEKMVDQPAETTQPLTTVVAEETFPEMTVPVKENAVNLGYGIYVTDIGNYTGVYMEDGSDEVLSNILMMVVKNTGEQDIQYAQITMNMGEQQAVFSLTTLPVGESMVLLEQNKMAWDQTVDYFAYLPKIENIAYFQEPVSLQEETLKVQILDGALNVTNISGEDISGTITVYYKNASADLYYGGITYRVVIDGGLKKDELRQVMTKHASDTGSKIMFVTINQ